MLRTTTALFATLVLLGAMSSMAAEPQGSETINLFNCKNLDGWQAHLVDPNVKMEDVWSVEDGILTCKGEPFGFLHTKNKYTNFRLVVEWRWPGEGSNCGVLMRVTGNPPNFLTTCVEAQLKHGDAGDIWGFYGFHVDGAEDRLVKVDHKVLGKFQGVKKIKDAEKPLGEWNKYEITLQGDKLSLTINREKVNEAHGLTVVSGAIGLQSEGGPIQFRTVQLTPLE